MSAFADHIGSVLRLVLHAEITPVLGAGANLCDRPQGFEWSDQSGFLPSGSELAAYLSARFRTGRPTSDLIEVASWVQNLMGERALAAALRDLFNQDRRVSSVQAFLARVVADARRERRSNPVPLIVTTNYDEMVERALHDVGEECDVVSYVAGGPGRGFFVHIPPAGADPIVIKQPREYFGLALEERPTILKLHGTINPSDARLDSFVLTEAHYVDYFTHDTWDAIPVQVVLRMQESHLLFLGYAMRDWDLLVVLRRLHVLPVAEISWAIQLSPDAIDEKRWHSWGIDVLGVGLDAYMKELRRQYELLRFG